MAYGIDPRTGERWILDGEQGTGEDQASWQGLLERGLHQTTGLSLLIHDGSAGLEAALDLVSFGPDVLRQRCVFHVLRNLRDAVRGDGLERGQKRARRQAVRQEAAAIWQVPEAGAVRRRKEAFVATWAEREPAVVATLERVFPATVSYLTALERAREQGASWQARWLRTTSPLERANRGIRQKARQVGVFGSVGGLEAGLGLVVAHRHPSTTAEALDWAEALEYALIAA